MKVKLMHVPLGGGSQELIETRGQEHSASNATTREFEIVNLSGDFATPTNDNPSSNGQHQRPPFQILLPLRRFRKL
jgi:hypothetical protein